VLIGLILSEVFNGNAVRDPFCFQKYEVSSIKQMVRGEENPYESLELAHDSSSQDL